MGTYSRLYFMVFFLFVDLPYLMGAKKEPRRVDRNCPLFQKPKSFSYQKRESERNLIKIFNDFMRDFLIYIYIYIYIIYIGGNREKNGAKIITSSILSEMNTIV